MWMYVLYIKKQITTKDKNIKVRCVTLEKKKKKYHKECWERNLHRVIYMHFILFYFIASIPFTALPYMHHQFSIYIIKIEKKDQ